jgi:uncharacterized integral membrane protein
MPTDPLQQTPSQAAGTGARPPRPKGRQRADVDRRFEAKTVAAIVVGILIIVFALINRQKVEIHFVIATAHTPLVVAIVISFLLGLALGYLVRRRSHRAPKRTP